MPYKSLFSYILHFISLNAQQKPPSLSRIYMLIILLNKPRLDDELLLFIRETVKIMYLLCLAILFIPALVYAQLFFTLDISDDPFLSNCNLYVG